MLDLLYPNEDILRAVTCNFIQVITLLQHQALDDNQLNKILRTQSQKFKKDLRVLIYTSQYKR